jgi:hypothetical protein
MAEILRLYVSAPADLESERAVIGRSIAELPVKIGVEIRRAPVLATFDEIFERLANVDRVYFLIGNDITAPSGLEWQLAWRLERSILPIRRTPHPTPAAQEFFHLVAMPWLDFRRQRELARIVSLDVARILKHPANRYGLTVHELEQLERHMRQLEAKQFAPSANEPGGAEGGGVLLDEGHREPLDGVRLND